MNRRDANYLRIFAVFIIVIFAMLVRNVWNGDRGSGFKLVHTALAVVCITGAAVQLRVVSANRGRNARWRAGGAEDHDGEPARPSRV